MKEIGGYIYSLDIWNIVPLLCFDIESNANMIITFKDPSQALCLIPWFLKYPSSFELNSLIFLS